MEDGRRMMEDGRWKMYDGIYHFPCPRCRFESVAELIDCHCE